MNIGIITQARMTSTRLPGKILKKAARKELLLHNVERSRWSDYPVYVATTTNKEDDLTAALCRDNNIPYFRGSEEDVLERYYQCALKFNLQAVVRVTSDCPLIDGHIIKEGIKRFIIASSDGHNKNIFLTNCHKRTFPRGFDFAIFPFGLLEKAFKDAHKKSEREHVIVQNCTNDVITENYARSEDSSRYRITVDTLDDFKLIKELFEKFNCASKAAEEIIQIMKNNPYLHDINKHIEQKKV